MHDGEGPGSKEHGPPPSAERLEVLRRQLYSRGGSADLLREYRGVEAALDVDANSQAVSDGPDVDQDVWRAGSRRRVSGRAWAVLACTSAAALVLVTAWAFGSSAGLPARIAPPAGPGRTLLFHSRLSNAQSAPDRTTFEPADERMLFRAEGRRLAVVLRCVGRGSVRFTAAEQRFDFRCDDQVRTTTRYSTAPVHGPFLILGRTIGNVVWGVRLTSVSIPT